MGVWGEAGSPWELVERVGEWKEEDRRAAERSRRRELRRMGERVGESELGTLTLPLLVPLPPCELPVCAAAAAVSPAVALAAECLSLTGLLGGLGEVRRWFWVT